MPILAPETDIYPSDVLQTTDNGRVWMVAQTKPRQEKSLARDLLELAVPFFAPCTARRNRTRGRIVLSYIPLFSGYIFLKADSANRGTVLRTNRVQRLLDVNDQNRLIEDLRQVQALVGLGLPLETIPLEAGEHVRIRNGPMMGLSGWVVRGAGRERFVVAVEFLGQGVAVELDRASLTRLPARRAVA